MFTCIGNACVYIYSMYTQTHCYKQSLILCTHTLTQLSQALAEVQDLKLRLSISKDELEHEKLRLQEELSVKKCTIYTTHNNYT